MTDAEQREAARRFANKWKGRGREDEDGRSYWIDFLSNVPGVDNVIDHVEFEKKVVVDGTTKRIDVYIPETHVLIEQKSLVGHKNVSFEQKKDMKRIFNNKQGRLDYVSAWYMLTSRYIQNSKIECAFVSTNQVQAESLIVKLIIAVVAKRF